MAAFAIHAAVSGTLGPRLPAIKEQAGLSTSALGLALVGFAAGLFVGTRIAARPIRTLGSRAVLRIGAPAFAVALLGPAAAKDLVSLTGALALLGVLAGLLDVAMNANAVVVERAAGRPILSGIHGAWSAALLAASGVAAAAAALEATPLAHFALVALMLSVASVPGLAGLVEDREAPRRGDVSGSRPPLRWAAVLPLGLIGFCSFLAEGSMSDWSAVYLHEGLGTSAAVAALGFGGFALGMTASRFVADGLSARFGPVAVVRAGGLVAGAGLAAGLLVARPAAAIAGFAVLGAALAPVVPTVFSAGGNLPDGARSLAWVVTLSYLGGILGPAAIGLVARAWDLRVALGVPAVLAAGIAVFARGAGSAPGGAPPALASSAEGPW